MIAKLDRNLYQNYRTSKRRSDDKCIRNGRTVYWRSAQVYTVISVWPIDFHCYLIQCLYSYMIAMIYRNLFKITEPQNGAARKPGHGSNTTLESIDFTLQHPASSVPSDPPSHGLLAEMTAAQKQQKKRNRESYLEAVSTGSVNDIRPSGRVSTEPVDL